MHRISTKMTALAAALVLSACGGGGSDTSTKVSFTSLVSFGDSLSDVGTYKVGTIAAAGGGKWTVNSTTTAPVNWTELLAGQLNLSAPCAARTGLLPSAALVSAGFVFVPMADHPSCTNYAQGGGRVTSVFGNDQSVALQTALGASNLGMETMPVVTQFAKYLATHTSYTGSELVTIMVGGNDVLVNLNGVAKAVAAATVDSTDTRTAAYAAAVAADWTTPVPSSILSSSTTTASFAAAAQTAAVTSMATAATELAAAIKTSVIGKGATHVVLVNIPNLVKTPMGQSQAASTQLLIDTMVTTFNSTLSSALSGTGVVIVDAYTQSGLQYDDPAQYGITNVTTPACSTAAYDANTNPAGNILGGSSLACTTGNTLSGVDVSTYFFADSLHPTPAGYKLLNRYVALQLSKAGWL